MKKNLLFSIVLMLGLAACSESESDVNVLATGVKLDVNTLTLTVGAERNLNATVLPENATNRNVIWSSGNPAVATVNAQGVVTAVSAGAATITVTTADGRFPVTCQVTVIPAPVLVTGVTVANCDAATPLVVGYTRQLTTTIAPANATNRAVTWESSDNSIATVSNNGLVTAVAAGTVTITAITECGSHTATCEITVIIIPVTGITITGANTIRLVVGATGRFGFSITPSNATNRAVTWSNVNSDIATVDANGTVTAVQTGVAAIAVTTQCGSYTDIGWVIVEALDVSSSIDGVVINGIRWATRNVNTPGTFADNPHDAGMIFQWNRRQGWASTGTVTGWDSTVPAGTAWYAANDPCPPGWRVPTTQEVQLLRNEDAGWVTYNGVNGRVFGTAPNQLFLPTLRSRSTTGVLSNTVGTHGFYWSNMAGDATRAWCFFVLDTHLGWNANNSRAAGYGVRCVSE